MPTSALHIDLIAQVSLSPATVPDLSALEWDLLVRQGRRAGLLGRLAFQWRAHGILDKVPRAPRQHLLNALTHFAKQQISIAWELKCLSKELRRVDAKITLLKGVAYALSDLPAAQGRSFSDVDILVPKADLTLVESELMLHGWVGTEHDAYDQRYYREWMHEIPPMYHLRRGTVIDVHHTILPETARVKVNARALLEGVVPLPGYANLWVLQPTDMLLHSATHLFHEGDFEHGLRDLFDLDSLLRHFGPLPGFWDALVPRAIALGLTRPLFYAVRYTMRMLGTPVPAAVVAALQFARPNAVTLAVMDGCYVRALRVMHPSTDSVSLWLARRALYLRSHWIRMPLPLLVYHLGRKAFLRPRPPELDKTKQGGVPDANI